MKYNKQEMNKLSEEVTKVPQIGPKSQKKLEKLDIYTIEDLLQHYPYRYEDRSKIEKISKVKTLYEENQQKMTVNVKAELTELKNIYTRSRKRITRGKAKDSSGEIQLIWFNMHYIKKNLKVGETYLISGKIGTSGQETAIIVPRMEKNKVKNLHMGRIVPVYPQTEGISSRWLRTRINDVLAEIESGSLGEDIKEFLPQELIEKYNHINLKKALKNIHFPKNQDMLNKARARIGYSELFLELLRVEKLKHEWEKNRNAPPIKTDLKEIKKYIRQLPFKLTQDQLESIKSILKDLQSKEPMNRLLEGDVGTGKTIVAIIASLAAVESNKNVLYMAPTEILAEQHFKTFNKFLEEQKTKLDISLVSGNTLPRIKKTEAKNSKNKKMDIIIGTHALLYSEEKYANVGLVIIDEQHRFGVEQREALLNFNKDKTTPHLLTMTATPIPRTLALTLYGNLNLSTLREKPNKGSKITTKVVPKNRREDVFNWIAAQKEPTFIVCPFIEESEYEIFADVKAATAEYETLKNSFFKDLNVDLLHGRIPAKEKTDLVNKFENGDLDVLVSTPVIEVGIDIPDATIMVIESAERYGLASLHQLRGRIGRGEKEGLCFVFTSKGNNSVKRLRYLEKYNDGLKLAEIDLKLRGPGQVYGIEQHGFTSIKIADLSNVELLEKIKEDAHKTFTKLDNYPNLQKRISRWKTEKIANN